MFFGEKVEVRLATKAFALSNLEEFFKGVAVADKARLFVLEVDAIGAVFQERFQQRTGRRQFGLGPFALGDILVRSQHADHAAVFIVQRHLAGLQPGLGAV